MLAFEVAEFRELTSRVIAAEKVGFWSDWTPEERAFYAADDWRAFSTSRGYTEAEIAEYSKWLSMCECALDDGLNPYKLIVDLTTAAALKNLALDTRGEIMKSSVLPKHAAWRLKLTAKIDKENYS